MAIPHPVINNIIPLPVDNEAKDLHQNLGKVFGATLDGNQINKAEGIILPDPPVEKEGVITLENMANAAASHRDPGEIK